MQQRRTNGGFPVPSGRAYQGSHAVQPGRVAQAARQTRARLPALGDAPPQPTTQPMLVSPPHPDWRPGIEYDPQFRNYAQIPAFYTCTINLSSAVDDDDSIAADSVKLRPERFVLKRITFATTGDLVDGALVLSSPQARAVEVSWSDEFTKFLGSQPCLIAALFGDSQGFLDLPGGVLFQGSQSLGVKLRRVVAVPGEFVQTVDRWDFNFQGIALLPRGSQSSGSAD